MKNEKFGIRVVNLVGTPTEAAIVLLRVKYTKKVLQKMTVSNKDAIQAHSP